MRHRLPLLVFLLYFPQLALAWPPTYGAEFAFTNNTLSPGSDGGLGGLEKAAAEKVRDAVLALCRQSGECRMRKVPGKYDWDYRFTFEDGFWFQVSYDPACVEVQTQPLTLEGLRKQLGRMRTYIFKGAAQAGFRPGDKGGGHFNFGANSAFDGDAMLFLRHFVDQANHPELVLGVLEFDMLNAPPLLLLQEDQRAQLRAIIEETRSGRLRTVQDVAEAIMYRVYTRTYVEGKPGYHYQAYGLKKLLGLLFPWIDAPAELRGNREQRTPEDFLLLAELNEARLRHLRETQEPVLFFEPDVSDWDAQTKLDRFFVYVTEAGEPWEKYETLLRGVYKNMTPSRFLRGKPDWAAAVWRSSMRSSLSLLPISGWVRMKFVQALSHPDAVGAQAGVNIIEEILELTEGARKITSAPIPLQARKMMEAVVLESLSRPAWQQAPERIAAVLKRAGVYGDRLAERLRLGLEGRGATPEVALAPDPAVPAPTARTAVPLHARCRMALRNTWDLIRWTWASVAP